MKIMVVMRVRTEAVHSVKTVALPFSRLPSIFFCDFHSCPWI